MKNTGYKDLEKFKKTKAKQKRRYYNRTKNAPQRGKPWSKGELQLVIAHNMSDTELSELLGRSVMAIQKQRQIYKKKEVEE